MERIKNIVWTLYVLGIILLSIYVTTHFNTEGIFNLFRSPVDLVDIEEDSRGEYIGKQSGEGIPVLTSSYELNDSTYSYNDYITVEPKSIMPLGVYRLKDSGQSRSASISYSGRRRIYESEIPLYTDSPFITDRYRYNQYYLIELQDGTYIVSYLDDYYAKKIMRGKKITFPMGRKDTVIGTEKSLLKEALEEIEEYDISEFEYILCLAHDKHYNNTRILDFIIRIFLGIIIFILFCVVTIIVGNAWKKRNP
jgi:hypothetical protein